MYSLVIYCIVIVIASIFGGSLPSLVRLTHRRIQFMLSFVSGVMLGVALLQLLPHSVGRLGFENFQGSFYACLLGLLFMFFMIRMFHFHQHDLAFENHEHAQKELCDHEQKHHHVHCDSHDGHLDITWAGLCFGLAIHTVIDGIALASAVQAGGAGFTLAGFGVFLAILLHKPLDALSITSLMAAKGWTFYQQLAVSVVFSLMCPLGAILFTLGMNQFEGDYSNLIVGYTLAFSAGIFLCVSLGDLLPEVHFHSHDRLKLSYMLIFGVLLAWLLEFLPGHSHQLPI